MKKQFAIIVAGGSGSRMGSEIPKQFLLLDGKPIIVHTIEKFLVANSAIEIVVILPESAIQQWFQIVDAFSFLQKIKTATGGATRFDSVKNGLALLPNDGIVAVHDAVRPLVSVSLIQKCFIDANEFGSSISAIACVDTVRQKNDRNYEILDRNKLWLMQTPQCFDLKKLKTAYHQAANNLFTDDAEVFAAAGFSLHLTTGEKNNIKITVPDDLQFAEWLMMKNK
jgi:2-C-methyl-D-erythritol 4-phosphate cytidylyltransferase